jgi:hypothetical protein
MKTYKIIIQESNSRVKFKTENCDLEISVHVSNQN